MMKKHYHLWFIYLINLSYVIQTIYAILFFISVFTTKFTTNQKYFELDERTVIGFHQKPDLPIPEKLLWILINIVQTIPFGVTALYWIFLYKKEGKKFSNYIQHLILLNDKNQITLRSFSNPGYTTTCSIATNYIAHALNSVVSLIDTLIIAVPIHVTHVIFPLIVTICYILFS